MTFTLLGAAAGSSDSGAQLERLSALAGGNVDGVLESRVSFSSSILLRFEQQQFGVL